MIVTFQSVVPMKDYTLEVAMANGNRLKFDMKPYLNTVKFYPLEDKKCGKPCMREKFRSCGKAKK